MAAPFGVWEVKFPSSRALWEADEEEEEEESTSSEDGLSAPAFHWSPQIAEKFHPSSPLECLLLVVAVGDVSAAFIDAHFLCAGSNVVALMTSDGTEKDFDSVSNTHSKEKTYQLHCLTRNDEMLFEVMFLQCRVEVPQEKAFYWTEKLFEHLKPSCTIILTSAPSCEYQTADPSSLKSDFVKMLKTDLWKSQMSQHDCSFLEPPNIVKGLAASVLSYCQIFKLQAALFVCFTETSHVDSQSVEAFQFLLKNSPLDSIHQAPEEDVRKILKSLGPGKLFENNMYM